MFFVGVWDMELVVLDVSHDVMDCLLGYCVLSSRDAVERNRPIVKGHTCTALCITSFMVDIVIVS